MGRLCASPHSWCSSEVLYWALEHSQLLKGLPCVSLERKMAIPSGGRSCVFPWCTPPRPWARTQSWPHQRWV